MGICLSGICLLLVFQYTSGRKSRLSVAKNNARERRGSRKKRLSFFLFQFYFIFFIFIFALFYFTILYWFCHTLTWIHHECTSSQSWTPLPPPTPYHLPGSSPRTSPKHPVSCIEHRLAIRFLHDSIHVSVPFSQIIPHSPSFSESKSPFYTSVSLLLSCTIF